MCPWKKKACTLSDCILTPSIKNTYILTQNYIGEKNRLGKRLNTVHTYMHQLPTLHSTVMHLHIITMIIIYRVSKFIILIIFTDVVINTLLPSAATLINVRLKGDPITLCARRIPCN